MKRPGAVLGLCALTAAGGCGSRSGLLETAPSDSAPTSGGAGGVAAHGGTGGIAAFGGTGGLGGTEPTGGTGPLGGAGGSPECLGLKQVSPVAFVAKPAENLDDHSPALVRTSTVADAVSVVFVRDESAEIAHATFWPWSGWPVSGDISPTHSALPYVQGPPYVVGQAGEGHFAAAFTDADPLMDFSFAPLVDAISDAPAKTWDLMVAMNGPGWDPRLVQRALSGEYLVGATRAGVLMNSIVTLKPDGMQATPLNLGCADAPIAAGAVVHPGGWLVAHADSLNGVNGCGGFDPGPPSWLDVRLVTVDGSESLVTRVDVGAPIAELVVAPHPSGMHVVYRVASGGAMAPIQWLRVDTSKGVVIGPAAVTGPAAAPMPGFAATAMGAGLVIAWGDDPAGNPPDLVVSLLNDSGSPLAETRFEPQFSGPLTALGASNGQSVVVGWSAGGSPRRIELARFDCE